ncbi:MAG: hypothetical protein HQK66_02895 [Desulfamplus sp.]|nr:hypothetical protein [Desulfamplus sp.]
MANKFIPRGSRKGLPLLPMGQPQGTAPTANGAAARDCPYCQCNYLENYICAFGYIRRMPSTAMKKRPGNYFPGRFCLKKDRVGLSCVEFSPSSKEGRGKL